MIQFAVKVAIISVPRDLSLSAEKLDEEGQIMAAYPSEYLERLIEKSQFLQHLTQNLEGIPLTSI